MKALREKLKQENTQRNSLQNDGASYQFWNIPENSTAVTRFLPDADPSNQFFWRERRMINLEFDGIVGQNTNGPTRIQVPCMEMYGGDEKCPILTEARRFYKEGKNELGQKYWNKKSYLFQSFIRQNPMTEENAPENPIRRMILNPSLYKIVYAYLIDEDNEHSPTDYEHGCDFKIKKTKNGTYFDYGTSEFARKLSPLTDEELAAIDQYGLFNLSEFMPKKPDSVALGIIQEMFEASLNGDAYDPSRFANYYKPFNLETGDETTTSIQKETSDTKETSTQTDNDTPPFDVDEPKKKVSPQEILARLRQGK